MQTSTLPGSDRAEAGLTGGVVKGLPLRGNRLREQGAAPPS
jgi:hypothetical protein